MADEIVTLTAMPVTVDTKTADDRGDNFTPTEDELLLDNNGDSRDTGPADAPAAGPAAAPTAAPAPAAAAPAPAADEADEVARQNGGQIPKSRFNEVNTARKKAEAEAERLTEENARLKAAGAAPAAAPAAPAPAPAAAAAFDVDAKEGDYINALLEGDTSKARDIRKEINAHILETATVTAERSVTAQMGQQQAANALQAASDQAVVDFPFLNTPEGAVALNVIVATRNHYMAAEKMPAHLALKKAVAEIAPRFAPADTPSRDSSTAAPAADTRTADALRRGAEDSTKQPPVGAAGIGNRVTQARIDVKNLDEKQFEALTSEEKKRLRGD